MYQFLYVIRELLRIFAMKLDLSNRRIAEIVGCSHPTIGRLKVKVGALTYTYDEYKVMNDDELISVLYPKMNLRKSRKRRPEFLNIEAELNIRPKKYGKKRKLMYLEYREKDPSTALGQTQFYYLANKHLKNSKLELKQEYFPGEYLSCDYAGIPLFITEKGTKRKVFVFVACLPFSRKMFAFATYSMTANDWILGLSKAALYFGKIAKVILFDNAKAMVRKSGLIAEISDRAIDFAQYHNSVCDTSRVGTPRDNCHSEKSVQFIEDRISLVLRKMTFFTLDELNEMLMNEVEKLNNEIMFGYKVSRNELFLQEDNYLVDLPDKPYELIIKQSSVKAPANYLIKYLGNYYSIPYQYRSQMVEFKATNKEIKIHCKGLLIAQHSLVKGNEVIIRLPEHMPKNHLAQVRKTKSHFVDWANDIGECCVKMIEAQYKNHANLKSQFAGKRCLAIQKIAANYIDDDFNAICKYGIEHEMFSPSDIKLIGQSRVIDDVREDELLPSLIAHHENIRGAEHYKGGL